MEWILLLGLAGVTVWQLVWGLKRRERHWQFPTLAAGCWAFYMLPMAIGVVWNPEKIPRAVLDDGGVQVALGMCALCAAATWYGWKAGLSGGDSRRGQKSRATAKDRAGELFWYGCLVYGVGLWGAWKLAEFMGGFRAQFTEGRNYGIEWTGEPVKYAFFAGLVYPGFLFSFRGWLERRDWTGGAVLVLMTVYPSAVAVYLGRREMTWVFLAMVGISVFFHRKWSVSPVWMGLLCAAAGVSVMVAPEYRTLASETGNVQAAAVNVGVRQALRETLCGERYSEFDALVVEGAFHNRELVFDYGMSLYNGLVNCLVPRQLVGEQAKRRLLVELYPANRGPEFAYGWSIPYGSNPTGPLDAFKSFWFFGALLYAGMGWCLARLWRRALGGSLLHQVVYAMLVPCGMGAVYGSWTVLPQEVLMAGVLIGPVAWLQRLRGESRGRVGEERAASGRGQPIFDRR